MLGLIVRNALGPIKLGQSSFDFGQKYEPLNSIVDGGIWRHRLEGLDNAVAGKWLLHGSIVNTFRGRWNYTLTAANTTYHRYPQICAHISSMVNFLGTETAPSSEVSSPTTIRNSVVLPTAPLGDCG
jgi:hypothetical protein